MCDNCLKQPPTHKNETLYPRLQAMLSLCVEREMSDCTDEKECERCGKTTTGVQWRRLNTAYVNERSNWICTCRDCYEDEVYYYEEQWADYYADCL